MHAHAALTKVYRRPLFLGKVGGQIELGGRSDCNIASHLLIEWHDWQTHVLFCY